MRIRKLLLVVGLVAMVVVAVFAGKQVLQTMGVLDPPASPGATSSYTLEDIYNRLNSGATGGQSTFAEPTAGPGTGTMHTLDDIMSIAPVRDDASGATTADVAADKTFWGLDAAAGDWGWQTGTSATCANCTGTLSAGGRWCNNGDGTVTDMTTGLVWLEKADWGWQKPWRNPSTDCSYPLYTCYDDAHTRAGILCDGATGAGLGDSSVLGDWRLPTLEELKALTTGTEPVSSGNMRAFSGVQSTYYWSSSTDAGYTLSAWVVRMYDGYVYAVGKISSLYVWPVRAGQ